MRVAQIPPILVADTDHNMSNLTEMTGFVMRNPSYLTKGVRESYQVAKQMRLYRNRVGKCEWTGRKINLQVHHNIPVSVCPERAADQTNFTLLYAKVHFWVPHAGNYKWYVENFNEIVEMQKLMKTIGWQERVIKNVVWKFREVQ